MILNYPWWQWLMTGLAASVGWQLGIAAYTLVRNLFGNLREHLTRLSEDDSDG